MIVLSEHELDVVRGGLLSLVQGDAHPHVSTAAALLRRLEGAGDRRLADLIEEATYAVVDFRGLAREAGERDPRTSPALRAADRLAAAIAAAKRGARP